MTQAQQPYAVRVFRDSGLWIIEVRLEVPVESVAVTLRQWPSVRGI